LAIGSVVENVPVVPENPEEASQFWPRLST
jgi:hypothetical protein